MAKTVNDWIFECQTYPFSQEAYELQETCKKIKLMNQYIEAQLFNINNEEYIIESGINIRDNYFCESIDENILLNVIYEAKEAKVTVWDKIVMGMYRLMNYIKQFFFKIAVKFDKSIKRSREIVEKLKSTSLSQEQVNKIIGLFNSALEANKGKGAPFPANQDFQLQIQTQNVQWTEQYPEEKFVAYLSAALSDTTAKVLAPKIETNNPNDPNIGPVNPEFLINSIYSFLKDNNQAISGLLTTLETESKQAQENGIVLNVNPKQIEDFAKRMEKVSEKLGGIQEKKSGADRGTNQQPTDNNETQEMNASYYDDYNIDDYNFFTEGGVYYYIEGSKGTIIEVEKRYNDGFLVTFKQNGTNKPHMLIPNGEVQKYEDPQGLINKAINTMPVSQKTSKKNNTTNSSGDKFVGTIKQCEEKKINDIVSCKLTIYHEITQKDITVDVTTKDVSHIEKNIRDNKLKFANDSVRSSWERFINAYRGTGDNVSFIKDLGNVMVDGKLNTGANNISTITKIIANKASLERDIRRIQDPKEKKKIQDLYNSFIAQYSDYEKKSNEQLRTDSQKKKIEQQSEDEKQTFLKTAAYNIIQYLSGNEEKKEKGRNYIFNNQNDIKIMMSQSNIMDKVFPFKVTKKDNNGKVIKVIAQLTKDEFIENYKKIISNTREEHRVTRDKHKYSEERKQYQKKIEELENLYKDLSNEKIISNNSLLQISNLRSDYKAYRISPSQYVEEFSTLLNEAREVIEQEKAKYIQVGEELISLGQNYHYFKKNKTEQKIRTYLDDIKNASDYKYPDHWRQAKAYIDQALDEFNRKSKNEKITMPKNDEVQTATSSRNQQFKQQSSKQNNQQQVQQAAQDNNQVQDPDEINRAYGLLKSVVGEIANIYTGFIGFRRSVIDGVEPLIGIASNTDNDKNKDQQKAS